MIVFDGFQLIIFAFIAICMFLLLLLRGIRALIDWKKTGFCFHKYQKIESTTISSWTKCQCVKCDKIKYSK